MAEQQGQELELLHQGDAGNNGLDTSGNTEACDVEVGPQSTEKSAQEDEYVVEMQSNGEIQQRDEEAVVLQSEGETKPGDGEVVESPTESTEDTPSAKTELDASEKHISIQRTLEDLEKLADVNGGGKKPCPLCPEEKFKLCYSHKLRRHLQNLHWKVSVEFQGCRMCICHLSCRLVKPNQNGEQSLVRLGAHYHCILCPATIARRTDMISHIKRHVNKGETEAKYSTEKSSPEIMKEGDTNVQILPNYTTPQKTDTYFNPRMKTNRQLIFCTLAALTRIRKPLECLDAFGSTGIMGLQWAKHIGKAVKVTINDINEKSMKMIQENCHINKMKVLFEGREEKELEDLEGEEEEEYSGPVEVTNMDANVIMHLRAFDFIHLDPYGTAVNYLDAAFRNVRNLGIVSVTSTDVSTLYCKSLNVAVRHYGCNIVRTEYYKELAARMVIAAVARAAARCNKGIEVLLSVALEHFFLVVVRVIRGPTQADESVKKIRYLLHCQWCEERVFQKEGTMVEENPYRQLPCECHSSMPGKTAVQLGPLWSGTLFNSGFLRSMYFEAMHYGIEEIQPLLKTLICESECTTLKQFNVPGLTNHNNQARWGKEPVTESTGPSAPAGSAMDHTSDVQDNKDETSEFVKNPIPQLVEGFASGKRKRKNKEGRGNRKKQKLVVHAEHPPFYYSIHRHSIKGMNIPKLNKFLQYLIEAGFRVSRTHFDPTGVRTDANLQQFKSVLMKHSTVTHTGGQMGSHNIPTEEIKATAAAP